MKLRITLRNLPNSTNPNRLTPSSSLHRRYIPSLLIRGQYMPKRTVRMTHSQPPCKWSLILLHLHLPPHCPRILLRLLPVQGNLKHRNYPPTHPHSHSLRRLRPPMRPDIILRSHSYHKPILCHPLHRTNTSRMSLRRILRRQPHPNSIFYTTLPPPIPNRQPSPHPLNLPS